MINIVTDIVTPSEIVTQVLLLLGGIGALVLAFKLLSDNIEKLAEVLLRYVGSAQPNGLEIVHIDEGSFYQCVFERGNYY